MLSNPNQLGTDRQSPSPEAQSNAKITDEPPRDKESAAFGAGSVAISERLRIDPCSDPNEGMSIINSIVDHMGQE